MVDRAYIASSCGGWCRIESTRWGAGGRACQGPEMELDRASHAASRLRVFAAATLFSTGGAAFKLCGFTGWQVKPQDRKSTRLNSSHLVISYAVFCLKKKKKIYRDNDQERSMQ